MINRVPRCLDSLHTAQPKLIQEAELTERFKESKVEKLLVKLRVCDDDFLRRSYYEFSTRNESFQVEKTATRLLVRTASIDHRSFETDGVPRLL